MLDTAEWLYLGGETASEPSVTRWGAGIFNSRPLIGAAQQFVNKLHMAASVPITANVLPNIPLMGANETRALLIIQNSSTATSPDVAPNFFIGFGQQPNIGFDLELPPGVGIVLDVRVPADAIYIAQSGGNGASVVVSGVVKEGAITDPRTDTANMGITELMVELIELFRIAHGLESTRLPS